MMKHIRTLYLCLGLAFAQTCFAQTLYFPPTTGNTWETTDPASLGWCTDPIAPLLDFLEGSNSKAFILLKDGRIVIEHYFGTFTADSNWYWASAGKSLTSLLVGKAQEEGFLNIADPSSTYLGEGWTSCTAEQEAAITIHDQGPGIPAAELTAVMQPFYRLESSRNKASGGVGLGLAIACEAIERQGGTLTLYNAPEGGLVATVLLRPNNC